ncbi:MAG: tRNA dihydrouridine(20/20a) synthase DusA [Alistipes senegalensis]|nr:tRNA dihydrouridine(20/20a) synthase DusA [Oxalobacter formigenes]MCM1281937.1 tRNA dihydrouridine(20/20a) synthase DusA [Alistipes senegalensis]
MNDKSNAYKPRTICVAPMLDWTDRHCRFFHRQITRHTWLYTEMVTTGALLYGDVARHLDFSEEEHPVALQLGGSEPADLARCAKLGEKWGYDEINLNCGCPSERVQKGAFGACLMRESALVADCVKAMQDVVSVEVTVKHRIGVDNIESYDFVRDFIGEVAKAGCRIFIVHARNAVLGGLSPKENREIPPLHYEVVYQLKRDFPYLEIILNGGVASEADVDAHLEQVDGVMIGRAAYHHPWIMSNVDIRYYRERKLPPSRRAVLEAMIPYMEKQLACYGEGAGGKLKLHSMTRHLLGIASGEPGARRFRQILSDPERLALGNPRLLMQAMESMSA